MDLSPDELDRQLRRTLTVGDSRLDALVRSVIARASRNDPPAAAGITDVPWSWATPLAAALLIGIAVLLGKPWHNDGDRRPTAMVPPQQRSDPGHANVVTLSRTGADRTSFDEPPGIGQVWVDSDIVVFGTVLDVDADAVRLRIHEVLRGQALLDLAPAISAAERGWSCTDTLAWRTGESCLLFLHRDLDVDRLVVTHDGSGKYALPITPYLGIDELRALLVHDAVPADAVAATLRANGPHVLREATWHLQGLHRERQLLASAAVQRALRDWLRSIPGRPTVPADDLLAALEFTSIDGLRELPAAVIARLRQEYLPVRDDPVNGRFRAFAYLEPLCRAGHGFAVDALRAHLDDMARPGAAKVHWQFITGGIAALATAFADEARGRLWAHYASIPTGEADERRRALGIALTLDPTRATSELLALLDARQARGFGLPIAELLRSGDPRARERLRHLFALGGVTPAADGQWQRAIEDVAATGDATALAVLIPDWLRAQIESRLLDAELPCEHFAAWLGMRLAYDRDLVPLRANLLRLGVAPADARRLTEVLRRDRRGDFGPLWRMPTDDEVRSFLHRLLAAIPDTAPLKQLGYR